MLDVKFIRENIELVKENSARKNEKPNIDRFIELDAKRRNIIQESQDLKNERNVVSKEIADLKKKKLDAETKIAEMKLVSEKIKVLDDDLRIVEEEIQTLALYIPNMLHESVPTGKTSEDNIQIRSWGKPKIFDKRIDHIEISKKLGIIDFERGAKVTGSGFAFYVGKGAALERALINFMLEFHIETNGYTEIMAPLMVTPDSARRTGQLPKMEEDMYYVEKDNFYLIPTAEVPITNYFADEMLRYEDLPLRFVGYTPCFRREAGSYGKETRGFLRVHQFNKVELVKFVAPERSYDELESITFNAETILQLLGLSYRVMLLCSGDTSFSSAKTYDIECWSPVEQSWLEVSSCSNFEDFQARRANIRFKRNPQAKPEFVHTLNGSGLATSRVIVAILEQFYDGQKLIVPEPLRKFTGFDYIK